MLQAIPAARWASQNSPVWLQVREQRSPRTGWGDRPEPEFLPRLRPMTGHLCLMS
jgi:hypothetical protein